MLSDIEISNKAELLSIDAIAQKLGIDSESIINYGKYMAKIDLKKLHI